MVIRECLQMEFKEFTDSIKGQKLAFVGVGISNISAILKFAKLGFSVQALDKNQVPYEIEKQFEDLGIELRVGPNYLKDLNADIYVRTPGLPFESEEIKKIKSNNKIITSELELFFKLCPCPIIGITGTSGKTTTTTIIYKVLQDAGYNVHVGGNIGYPIFQKVDKITKNDIAVIELSSFQLESMRKSPNIAVITNLTPNHINVHKTMENYVKAKTNITLHQDSFSRLVLNQNDRYTKYFTEISRAKIFTFGIENSTTYVENDVIYYEDRKIMNVSDIKIQGKHNLENYLAAITALGNFVSVENIKNVASEFNGVEHRIEFCGIRNGVCFYNDSIATTPLRTITALSLFKGSIILIAGGSDKGLPFDVLGDEIAKKVKYLILFGDTSEKIYSAVKNSKFFKKENIIIKSTTTMKEAVNLAISNSKNGDTVLFSPACASFDKFKNFEERGNSFKAEVLANIKKGH